MRPVSEQVALFALMVTMGIVLGVIFDFYRALRGIAEPGKLLTIMGDIIFWLIATALVFSVLMWRTWGEMRAYVLIGLILGFLIHWFYFSPIVIKLFRSFILFLVWIYNIVWRIVSWPFVMSKNIILPVILYGVALGRAGNRKIKTCGNKYVAFLKKIFKKIPKDE